MEPQHRDGGDTPQAWDKRHEESMAVKRWGDRKEGGVVGCTGGVQCVTDAATVLVRGDFYCYFQDTCSTITS